MVEGMFIAFLAKALLATIAVFASRLTLHFLDQLPKHNFKDWIDCMYEKHPDKLALYYGLRYVGVAIIFALILG